MREHLKRFFNPLQLQIIGQWVNGEPDNRPEIMLLDGAVGSGKTYALCYLYPLYVYQYENQNLDFIITGQSAGSIERNILTPIRKIWGPELDTSPKGGSQKYVDWYGNRIWLFGTRNADSHEAFQGMTAQGHLGDEITLTHYNSFQEILSRTRAPGAAMFWTCNPAGPSHHIYKNYLIPWEREGNTREFTRYNFTLWDNAENNGGFLPGPFIRRLERRYRGVWYNQRILGQWVAIEGQVYHMENLNWYDPADDPGEYDAIYGWYDPASGGSSEHGCYDAIITAGVKKHKIYILEVILDKIGPLKIVQRIEQLFKRYQYTALGIESNFQQRAYVVDVIKEKLPHCPIIGIESRENKLDRLINMQTVISDKVYFPSAYQGAGDRDSEGSLLIRQLCNISAEGLEKKPSYPEQFIDGPDALEGVIRMTARKIKNPSGSGSRAGGTKMEKMEF